MRDQPVIFAGLAIFLSIATFPFWYNKALGTAAAPPALRLPAAAKQCVAPVQYMKANHMRLLDSWRTQVVRTGTRQFRGPDGQPLDMSLTRTCLACHQDRAEFCDRCHSYSGVSTVECWNCHNSPGNVLRSAR